MENRYSELIRGIPTGYQKKAYGLGIDGDAMDEILHHMSWAREKYSSFIGREEDIQSAMKILCNTSSSDSKVAPTSSISSSRGISYLRKLSITRHTLSPTDISHMK